MSLRRSRRDALAAGVGMVHQELAFCENLSVAENLCLGALPSPRGFARSRAMRQQRDGDAGRRSARSSTCGSAVGELTIGQQQMLQIAAAVGTGAQVIVFDEPTSSLSQHEADELYELIDRLRARGVTCIYVSHRMEEIFRLCDTVTVLRDGRHVATRPIAGLTAGRARADDDRPAARGLLSGARSARRPATSCCASSGLSSPGRFHDVSFSLRAGEVLGFAGLVGAGRSEVAQALFGLDPLGHRARAGPRPAARRCPVRSTRCAPGSAWSPRIASGRGSCSR